MRDLYNIVKNIELLLACTLYLVLHCISDYIYNYHSIVRNNYITSAILYSLNTVPSVDSSIPVTIQPVVSHNMLNITVFVNVRKSLYIRIILCSLHFHQSKKHSLLCKLYVKQKCFCWYRKMFNPSICIL